jgi:uncharacterized protein involved in copper resistance
MKWNLTAVSVLFVAAALAAGCSKSEPEDVAPAAAPAAETAPANETVDAATAATDSATATMDSAAAQTDSMAMPAMDSVGTAVDSVTQ